MNERRVLGRQGDIGARHLVKDQLVSDAAMVSKSGDETRSRAVVVVPDGTGTTLLTIGHVRQQAAMVGQVPRWPVEPSPR